MRKYVLKDEVISSGLTLIYNGDRISLPRYSDPNFIVVHSFVTVLLVLKLSVQSVEKTVFCALNIGELRVLFTVYANIFDGDR